MNYIVEQSMDIIPDIDWDTFKAKAGEYQEQRIDLFTKPISQHKSLLETSMWESMRFPMPQHKNVTALQVAFSSFNDPSDTQMFRENCRYEFFIGQKLYDYGPMIRFQYWSSLDDFEKILQDVKLAKKLDLKLIGNEVGYLIGDNSIGHHILQGQTFFFRLVFDEIVWCPRNDFKMVVILKGVKARGIQ